MFCRKCGAEIPDGAKFCAVCGVPAQADAAHAGSNLASGKPALNVRGQKPVATAAAKSGNKKPLLIGIAALVVLVLLIVVLVKGCAGGSSGSGFRSPEEAFEAFFNGYSEQDFERMMQAFPDFWIEYFGGEEAERQQLQRNYENDWVPLYEGGLQYTHCRATGHTLLSEEEVAQIEQEINDDFGVDIHVTEAATIEYELINNYGSTKETEEVSSHTGGYAYKYDGKWYYTNYF